MTDYRFSKYLYKPRRRKSKLAVFLILILAVGGGVFYTIFFLEVRSFYADVVDMYRIVFNDFRFLEKNLQSGNYNIVVSEGTPYLARRPNNPRLIRYIGEAYYHISSGLSGHEREEAIEKAIRHMRKGIVLSPFNDLLSKSYYVLGMSYFRKGAYYYELAAEYLKKSLDAGYRDDSVFEVLGYCYYRLGVYDEAIVYLEKVKTAGSKEVVRLYLADCHRNNGDYKAAMGELELLVGSSTDDAILEEAYSIMSWVSFQEGDYARSREYLAKVFELNENSSEAHFWLGNIFEKEGDLLSARKEWRTALKMDPKHVGAIEKLY